MKWLYTLLLLSSVSIPLAFSFENKVRFFKNYRFLFPAIVISAILFLTWDYFFTRDGIWHFNREYVLGYFIAGMPAEEWLFFILIPYACIFIHDALKFYLPKVPTDNYGKTISFIVIIFSLVMVLAYNGRLYTIITFTSLAALLFAETVILKSKYTGRFFFTYIITLIPFLVVNGFLTAMPVLIYNNNENSGIRVGTIPLEDFFYWMLLLLLNIAIYERLQKRVASAR